MKKNIIAGMFTLVLSICFGIFSEGFADIEVPEGLEQADRNYMIQVRRKCQNLLFSHMQQIDRFLTKCQQDNELEVMKLVKEYKDSFNEESYSPLFRENKMIYPSFVNREWLQVGNNYNSLMSIGDDLCCEEKSLNEEESDSLYPRQVAKINSKKSSHEIVWFGKERIWILLENDKILQLFNNNNGFDLSSLELYSCDHIIVKDNALLKEWVNLRDTFIYRSQVVCLPLSRKYYQSVSKKIKQVIANQDDIDVRPYSDFLNTIPVTNGTLLSRAPSSPLALIEGKWSTKDKNTDGEREVMSVRMTGIAVYDHVYISGRSTSRYRSSDGSRTYRTNSSYYKRESRNQEFNYLKSSRGGDVHWFKGDDKKIYVFIKLNERLYVICLDNLKILESFISIQ
ncbi:MAG: hypothetical protein RSD12_06200 [Akkermansia sp.]